MCMDVPVPQDYLLSSEELCFERDDRRVFEGINLRLKAGEMALIEGPNGCGKTTLMRLLATLLSPTSGALHYRGEPLEKVRYEYLADLLYICLLYTSPSPRDEVLSRMPSSA